MKRCKQQLFPSRNNALFFQSGHCSCSFDAMVTVCVLRYCTVWLFREKKTAATLFIRSEYIWQSFFSPATVLCGVSSHPATTSRSPRRP